MFSIFFHVTLSPLQSVRLGIIVTQEKIENIGKHRRPQRVRPIYGFLRGDEWRGWCVRCKEYHTHEWSGTPECHHALCGSYTTELEPRFPSEATEAKRADAS